MKHRLSLCATRKGFTLLEFSITFALLMAIAAFAMPIAFRANDTRNVQSVRDTVLDAMRHAREYATSGYQDADWGVRIGKEKIEVFRGDVYEERDTAFDEVSVFPVPAQDITGSDTVIFLQSSGRSNSTQELFTTMVFSEEEVIRIHITSRGIVYAE